VCFDSQQWLGSGADSWRLLIPRDQNLGDTGLKDDTPCVRQTFPFLLVTSVKMMEKRVGGEVVIGQAAMGGI
jgi:hypothetical protein